MIEREAILRKMRIVALGQLALVFRFEFSDGSLRDGTLFPRSLEGSVRAVLLHFGVTDSEQLADLPCFVQMDGLGTVKGFRSYSEDESVLFDRHASWSRAPFSAASTTRS